MAENFSSNLSLRMLTLLDTYMYVLTDVGFISKLTFQNSAFYMDVWNDSDFIIKLAFQNIFFCITMYGMTQDFFIKLTFQSASFVHRSME